MSGDRSDGSWLAELRRRRVPSVILAYLLVAWGIIEITDVVFPEFAFPEWSQRFVIVLAALGVPIVLVVAWAYDLTLRGPVRTGAAPEPHETGEAIGAPPARSIDVAQAVDAVAAARWHRLQNELLDVLDARGEERERRLSELAEADPVASVDVQSLVAAHDAAGPVDEVVDWLHEGRLDLEEGAAVGSYTLGQRLGGGGMGIVYRAMDERLDRPVALKFLSPSIATDRSARERFMVEARAAAALDHPNICTILEIGETPHGQVFLSMPFYEGETLKARIARGALPPDEALDVAAQIGRGLAAAHGRGIVHRDVKPANVMLTRDGVAKIVDFGIAKIADIALTRTGTALGTVSYMSPEQARGEAVDHRTDLWSLGVLIFEMLTGSHPFPGGDEQAIRAAILGSPHPALAREIPELDSSVGDLIDQALEKDRERRYPSATALVADLEAVRAGVGRSPRSAGGAVLPRGERRICTALVVAVPDYDHLVDELGPDELTALSRRLETAVGEAVSTEGGRVLDGDGRRFQAVFGIPVTHEDDARRGIRAALTVRERFRLALAGDISSPGRSVSVQIGLDSGTVAVRLRNATGGGYHVSGRPVRVAEELARRAGANEILVTSECRRLAGAVETGGTKELDVAGVDAPVPAHSVLAQGPEPSSFEHWTEEGLTEFLGRTEEMEALERVASPALRGEGALVEIVGEPGVGKSRLLFEFSRTLGPTGARVLAGRCKSVARASSYAPIAQVLREYLAGSGGKAADLTAEEAAAGLLAIDANLGDALPLLLQLLALNHPDHPLPRHLKGDQLRVAVTEAVAGLLSVIAMERPLVLLFEDWHWADDASNLALLQLAYIAPTFPILVAVTYRPGYGVDLRAAPNLATVRLGPIGETTVGRLLQSVLGSETVDPELTRAVAARTGGNPFFIEEVAADLREQGVVTVRNGIARLTDADSVRLPDSVQAAIRTRLDRVDPATRGILFVASVIGREFSRALLGTLADASTGLDRSIDALKDAGLIQQTQVIPEAHYRFKHALTQEVTYESLLAHQRRELHRKVGEVLEQRRAEAEDDLDILAHHFGEACVWSKAVGYGLRAVRRAIELSENDEALSLLTRVERWAESDADDGDGKRRLLEILLTKERLLDVAGNRTAQKKIIEKIRGLADAATEAERCELELREGDLWGALGRYDQAQAHLMKALEGSREAADHVMQRRALQSLGLLYWHQGLPELALPPLEEALALDRRHGDVDGELGDLFNIMVVLRGLGDHERAIEVGREIQTRAGSDYPFHVGLALHGIAQSYRLTGRLAEAIPLFEQVSEVFAGTRMYQQRSYNVTSLANLYFQVGNAAEALRLYRQAVEDARRVRHGEGLAVALEGMANVLKATGRGAEAIPLLEEAEPLLAQLEDTDARANVLSKLAALYAAEGRQQDAITAWGAVRQLAAQGDRSALEITALEGLATASREHFGQGDLAIPLYEEAVAKARALDDHRTAGRLLNSLGVIAWERQDWDRSRGHYEEALEAFRKSDHTEGIGLVLASLGAVWHRLGQHEEAERALQEAISVTGESQDGARVRGYALGLVGDIRRDRNELELAESAYRDSLAIRERLSDRRGEGWMLLKLAEIEERRGALDRVRELSSQAYQIATAIDDEQLMQACTAQERY